jgi:hypothetical protein
VRAAIPDTAPDPELGVCCQEAATCPGCDGYVCQDHPCPIKGEAVLCDHHDTLVHVDCHRGCEPYTDCGGTS